MSKKVSWNDGNISVKEYSIDANNNLKKIKKLLILLNVMMILNVRQINLNVIQKIRYVFKNFLVVKKDKPEKNTTKNNYLNYKK